MNTKEIISLVVNLSKRQPEHSPPSNVEVINTHVQLYSTSTRVQNIVCRQRENYRLTFYTEIGKDTWNAKTYTIPKTVLHYKVKERGNTE
jgi:hypothetical protein